MRVALLGATGLVGREMMRTLEARGFPASEVVPLASSRSRGSRVPFRGGELEVLEVNADSFVGVDIAFFSAGADASRRWAPEAKKKGAVVIDNSSAWRMDPDVPLVVPEVNPGAMAGHKGLIANPNCATIQAVMALKPLHDAAGLVRFSVVTFQSVSGTGKEAIEELAGNSGAFLSGEEGAASVYPHDIAFDVLPQIGGFDEDGVSEEEWKMIRESRKIMGIPGLEVRCTAVRVPVFRGHSEAVTAIFERVLTPGEARELLSSAPGVRLLDEPSKGLYPTARGSQGREPVFVGRVRRDTISEKGLMMWVVSDNLLKGAALNAVQIAEALAFR
ncbi:MAG TPA: aspartate-semialdehyde dehydrogenase [Synergistales bacterium]|nr:aspartate-semialdehyde dehydrogenase [Synergistales bacterium]